MELQKLLEKTVKFVHGGWHEKTPTYEEDPVWLKLPEEVRAEIKNPYPQIKKGIKFEELTEGALKLTEQEVFQRVNSEVPNSPEAQLVDFCSGAGVRFTHGFARRHPQTTTLLVDQIDIQHLPGLFYETFALPLRSSGKTDAEIHQISRQQGFERYEVEVPFQGNVPDYMQSIFDANDLPNMAYAHRFIGNETKLDDVIAPDKKTYCTGWNCPADAGINALKQAVKHDAEAIILTHAGPEYSRLRKPLSKKTSNIAKWDELMEKAKAEQGAESSRYDYNKPEERKLGFALKHARILDSLLWLEEKGYNTKLILLEDEKNYNAPEHIVYAFKQHDILIT